MKDLRRLTVLTDNAFQLNRFGELPKPTYTLLIVLVMEHHDGMGNLNKGSAIELILNGVKHRCNVLSYGPEPNEQQTGLVHIGPLLAPNVNWLPLLPRS